MFTYESIQTFPKSELHCHLDGSIRPETLQQIARVQHLPIEEDLALVREKMQASKTCQNLEEYLVCFDYVLPYLQTKEALRMAAFDVMEQAANDGVVYLEIRFAPSLSMEKGLSVSETLRAVAQGIKEAQERYAIIGNILVCGMRNTLPTQVNEIFTQVLAQGEEKVVGFDLAGPEVDGFALDFKETLQLIDHENVQLTLHAGECGCTKNIHQAIESGAKRIGHGISLAKNLDRLPAEVCIEGCPTSNIQTQAIESYEQYPIRQWLEREIVFCLNTDNRTVSNTTLTNEYYQITKTHHLTEAEFRLINRQGIIHAFTSEEIKAEILQKMAQSTLERI
ncbi:adenosine deaminase [Enterococcus bulliens]